MNKTTALATKAGVSLDRFERPADAPPPADASSIQESAAPPPADASSIQESAAPPPADAASTQESATPPPADAWPTQESAAPPPADAWSLQEGATPPPADAQDSTPPPPAADAPDFPHEAVQSPSTQTPPVQAEDPSEASGGGSTAPPPSPPVDGPRMSLRRRLARLARGLVSPWARRIIFRILLRLRFAVDTSETATAVRRLEVDASETATAIRRLEVDASDTAMAIHRLEVDTSATATAVRRLDEATTSLRAHLDARIDHLLGQGQARFDQTQARLSDLQQGLDILESRVREAMAHEREAIGQRLNLLESQSHETFERVLLHLDVLHMKMDLGEENLEARLQELRSAPRAFSDVLAVQGDDGVVLIPADHETLAAGLARAHGNPKPGVRAVLDRLCPGDRMIDAGAGVGVAAVAASRRVGASGRVIAVEGAPRLSALLRRTARFNAMPWLEVQDGLAGEADETRRIAVSNQTVVLRLDDLVPAGEAIALVRLQGANATVQAWRGMQRIVEDNPHLMMLIEFGLRQSQSAMAWLQALRAAGFEAWDIGDGDALHPATDAAVDVLIMRDAPSSRGLICQ